MKIYLVCNSSSYYEVIIRQPTKLSTETVDSLMWFVLAAGSI